MDLKDMILVMENYKGIPDCKDNPLCEGHKSRLLSACYL